MTDRRTTETILTAALTALLLICLTGCSRAAAPAAEAEGPLTASLTLSTNSIRVGDIITAELQTLHPTGTQVRVPGLGTGKEIVVRNRDWNTVQTGADQLRTTALYELTSFRVGIHTLSKEDITCEVSEGEPLTVPFPFTNITVFSVVPDPNAVPADIKGLAAWPRAVPRWLWAFLVVVLLAVILAMVAHRYLGTPRTIIQQPPPPPPHEVALSALARLKRDGLIQRGETEPFYVRLSAIVRLYIENRFGLRAPEQTTEEFIREASRSHALSSDHQKLTQAFLLQSDLVKFAKHEPGPAEMEAALASGERLVRETMQAEQSGEPTGGEG